MDLTSSIAAASMVSSQAKLAQAVNVAVIKKSIDQQETQGAALIELLETAAPPSNHILDVRA